MPQALRNQMSAGKPMSEDQREELISSLKIKIRDLYKSYPERIIFAGLVLIRNEHVILLASCNSKP